jgi:hypothetical protein
MKAWIFTDEKSPLELRDVPDPTPGATKSECCNEKPSTLVHYLLQSPWPIVQVWSRRALHVGALAAASHLLVLSPNVEWLDLNCTTARVIHIGKQRGMPTSERKNSNDES